MVANYRLLLTCTWLFACGQSSPTASELKQPPAPQPSAASPTQATEPATPPPPSTQPGAHLPNATLLSASLPRDSGPFYPSQLRVADDGEIDLKAFANVQACTVCHEAAGEHWADSAHAHASFDNPWYRASVDALRESVGFESSRHCAGCHDPLPLLAGKMDGPVDAGEPLSLAGITCLICHSAAQATSAGNASLTLDPSPVPIPQPGDAASLAAHRRRLAPTALKSPALCASCHRGFLGPDTGNPHHLFGMDEPGAWSASAFGGSGAQTLEPIATQTCSDCHMQWEVSKAPDPSAREGQLRSHRFAGGHSALAAQLASGNDQEGAVLAQLRKAVRIDIPVVYHDSQPQPVTTALTWQAGDTLSLDVTLRNIGAGHSFPGGLKDTQDTWVELVVLDAQGTPLARSGHERPEPEPQTTHFLQALVIDGSGKPETSHTTARIGMVAYDHTLAALDARVVRYTLKLPPSTSGPLQAKVLLRHRRHRPQLREAACQASRSARGRAFHKAGRQHFGAGLDGCAPEPVHLIAEQHVWLGRTDQAVPRALWERLYDHALGLSHDVQENLDQARLSAERGLAVVPDNAPAHARANFQRLLGQIAARQGRTAVALEHAGQAEALVGEHAAIARVRADAFLRVWRFAEAQGALEQLVRLAPTDTTAHRDLAQARLAQQAYRPALQAAQAGLRLQPRDEGLLRTQAVALRHLNSPQAEAAHAAFLRYRQADDTTTARLACDRNSADCANKRHPIVQLELPPLLAEGTAPRNP